MDSTPAQPKSGASDAAAKLPGARGVLANAGWLYLDQVVRAGATLVTFGLMTRALGPTGFGYLSYALAFPGIFLPLAWLGLDYVLVQEFVRRPEERAAVFSAGFWLKVTGSAVAFVVCVAAGAWCVPADAPAKPLLIVTALSLLFQPALIVDFFFQSRIASKYSSLARMTSCLAVSGVRGWLVVTHRPVVWFAWAYVLEVALLAAGLAVALRLGGDRPAAGLGKFDRAIARRLLAAAWPLLLADIAIALYLRLSQVLLEHLSGAEVLGRYAAAMRLGDALEFFPLAIIGSYFPHIVALHHAGAADFAPRLRRFFGAMTWGTVAIAAGVSVLGPWLVGVVMGANFAAAAPLLVAIVWGNVFATQVAVRGRWFLAEGLQLYTFFFFAAGAAVQLALLFALAPRFGAEGAALAYLVAQAVMALVVPLGSGKTRFAGEVAWTSFLPRWSIGAAATVSTKATDRVR